ncbi:hypothetical protein Hanom_Chr07g00605911 [Helianthus anomalus]
MQNENPNLRFWNPDAVFSNNDLQFVTLGGGYWVIETLVTICSRSIQSEP